MYRLTYNDDVAIICETAHQIPFLLDLGKIVKQSSLSEFRPIARKLRKHRDYGFPFHSGYRSSDRDPGGRRSLGAEGTRWHNVLLPRLQGTAALQVNSVQTR